MTALDHLVLVAPDIDDYVRRFTAETGVAVAFGGSHPGRGTKNYLVGLEFAPSSSIDCSVDDGIGAYLEFLGLDENQPDVPAEQTMFGVGTLGRSFVPQLLTWAVHGTDIDELASRGRKAGFAFASPVDAARTTPAGELLRWRFAVNPDFPFAGLQPFLIDWGDTPHPSQTPGLPKLKLRGLSLVHPDPGLSDVLAFLGLDIPCQVGPRSFSATFGGLSSQAEFVLPTSC
ncbi:MAG: VOC family protein [Propionibacteriaceae bacterium]|jgi:hypothetical protein|nr:VOC family protein [Propionibacteriaceae bacterium]